MNKIPIQQDNQENQQRKTFDLNALGDTLNQNIKNFQT